MGSSWKSEEIIILSDDEDDKDTSCIIVEVEDVKTTGNSFRFTYLVSLGLVCFKVLKD